MGCKQSSEQIPPDVLKTHEKEAQTTYASWMEDHSLNDSAGNEFMRIMDDSLGHESLEGQRRPMGMSSYLQEELEARPPLKFVGSVSVKVRDTEAF